MIRRALPAMVLAALMLATGCTDVVDVNRRVLVYAIGLDVADNNQYEVSLHYIVAGGAKAGGGGAGGQPTVDAVTHSASALSITRAIQEIMAQVPGEIFLGSVRLVIFGEDLARQGLGPPLDALMRTPQMPTNALTAVAVGRAGDLLQSQTETSISPAVYFVRLVEGVGGNAGRVATKPLFRLFDQSLHPHKAGGIPVIEPHPQGPFASSVGLLRGDRLQTKLPIDDIGLSIILTGGSTHLELPTFDESTVPIVIRFRTVRTHARLSPDADSVTVRIRGSAYLVEGTGTTVSRELARRIESAVQMRIEEFVRDLYAQSLDVLNVAEQMRRRTRSGRLPDDWQERLPELTFHFETQISLLHGLRGR